VIAQEWFASGRKRPLLAPFGVGTVDQLLLAALKTKHVFVRLFGLAGKTVVIDEVHAYDTYMTVLLERALEWLGAMKSPVVLLSATLPRGRARQLVTAYRRGLEAGGFDAPQEDQPPNDAAYPRVTWLDANGNAGSVHVEPYEGNRYTLELARVPVYDPEGVARLLVSLLDRGGCAAVICNTVARSQEVYLALKPYFPGVASDNEPVLDLFHARFLREDRNQREIRSVQRFGRDGPRPDRAVLVATQVVEQSLDLDFDVMITDFAPADLLLQRAGRLHRHKRGERGPRTLHILWPQERDGVPGLSRADAAVYAEHTLLRTWLALNGGDAISVPGEVEELIEAVYDGRDCPELADSAVRDAWLRTAAALAKRDEAEWHQAQERMIPPPWSTQPLSYFTRDPLEEDDPALHQAFQALTRLGDPSVDVVCLVDAGSGPTLPDGQPVDPGSAPGALLSALRGRTVSLSHRGVVPAILASDVPEGWKRSPLRHSRLLTFDGAGRLQDRWKLSLKWELSLDRELGLVITNNIRGGEHDVQF
jgi:CRISPR-associated endonuclease/helicase Cas3